MLQLTRSTINGSMRSSIAPISSRAFSCTPSTSSAPRVEATRPASQEKTVVPKDIYQFTKAYPRHPLLNFFGRESRKVKLPGTDGETREERVPVSLAVSDLGPDRSGRSWMASELRTKSSLELHQLWYVCLLERNKLATTKTEIQRVGATPFAALANYNGKRIEGRVRKTMARIKFVLNERRIALLDAQDKAAQGTLWAEEEEVVEGHLYEESPEEQKA